MTTAEEIAILLNSKERYDTKKLIQTIIYMVYGDFCEEGYEGEEVRKQIVSEMLYLFERAKKKKVTTAFVRQRINFLRENCRQWQQVEVTYDDKLKIPEVTSNSAKTKTRRGWTKRTCDRYLRYVCGRKTLLNCHQES